MSGRGDDDAEKSHEPSRKKLEDARRRGEVPKSTDLTTAAAYAGLLSLMMALGAATTADLGGTLAQLLAQADTLSASWFSDSGTPLGGGLLLALTGPLALWLGGPACAVLIALVAQRAVVLAPERVAPKLNRISPLTNAKNKFGRAGLFEFAKSAVKLTLYSVILGTYLWRRLPELIATVELTPAGAVAALARLTVGFFAIVLAVAATLGVIDLLWQHQEHLRKNRMTRKELTDETKESEGDPHIKGQRRQRGTEIAMNAMLSDVPDADVVVVNPTHFAVALKWARLPGSAPVCVAKGVDEVAARIREVASEHGVPIHSDPPTARALHATVDIGREVPPEAYGPVAAAIRFAEEMRAKARRRIW